MADSTSQSSPTCDVDGTCYCPLTGIINTLSRKYAMQLISIIGAHESMRFAEIEAHLSKASTSTISKRLSEFENAGIVTRTQYDEIPPRVEYALTEEGYAVRERLEPLLEWAATRSDTIVQ
ncbi:MULTISPECIES: winged helix-turn-helix transcriptional regulator [Haloferacaceae]|uniref:Transcriptional regulator n=2 Tax=Haloferacaceae TaxID=1644056 RepID=A0A8J8PAA6_9EURY|nr:helix-turn-helix domain-containing protein [Halohasta litorea]TQQ78749.1 transcriptional regulator [Halonotius terrestris]